MSKPQGPTFCRAQVAWELSSFWGPLTFPDVVEMNCIYTQTSLFNTEEAFAEMFDTVCVQAETLMLRVSV